MTTNKRFKNVEENLEWGTVHYFTYHDEKITDKEIEKLVNHLLNQNEELKKENLDLSEELDYYKTKCASLENGLFQADKENEQLKKENKELRQDNDIKFWKHQFMMTHNASQIIMHEISRAVDEGYEISEEFQKYLNELRVQNDKNKEKMERLRI